MMPELRSLARTNQASNNLDLNSITQQPPQPENKNKLLIVRTHLRKGNQMSNKNAISVSVRRRGHNVVTKTRSLKDEEERMELEFWERKLRKKPWMIAIAVVVEAGAVIRARGPRMTVALLLSLWRS